MWGHNIFAPPFGWQHIALAIASVTLLGTGSAQACTTCVGMYGDVSLMGEIIYQVERLHSYLMESLAGAERAAQAGHFSQAALLPLALGFTYGAVHALGPGHGKVVVAGYFAGRPAPLREAIRMAAEISLLHVGSAFILALVAAILLGGVISMSGPAFVAVKLLSYGLIALAGALMVYRAAISAFSDGATPQDGCGHHHHHSVGTDGDAETKSEGHLLALAVGAVPCTGALIAVLFALASGAWLLGILTVAAISVGMGLTLAGVGLLTIKTRNTISPGSSATLNVVAGAGGCLVLAVGAVLFMGTASLV